MSEDIGVIPAPENRKAPVASAAEAGTVSSIDGTTASVYVSAGMVGVTGPVMVVGGELAKFLYYVTTAGMEAAENAASMAGEDGGTP